MRNERVNVAYFTPMKTARIITRDRGRTRKFSAVLAVDAAYTCSATACSLRYNRTAPSKNEGRSRTTKQLQPEGNRALSFTEQCGENSASDSAHE